MEYFTEQARTYSDCIDKIRKKYGNRANILVQKTIRMGGFLGFFSREGVEISGVVAYDFGRNASESGTFSHSGTVPRSEALPKAEPRSPMDFETEKKKILASVNPKVESTLQVVLSEVRTIKEKIQAGNMAAPSASAADHPSITRIREILHQNDFTPHYTGNIIERMRKEFSLDALEDFDALQDAVAEWIGESIRIYEEEEKRRRRPRIMTLVGPTGVGKTTTIAKLAAIYGTGFAGRRPLSVCLVTIDNYRIGASYQIEKYGDIMKIPVYSVTNYRDLKQVIALNSEDTDLILIDTIGKSPRAAVELAEMKQLLDACGSSAEFHLAVAAVTKSCDILEILMQYEPFAYRSVIVTKMDETIRLGNVISALSDRGKSVSFITEGQQVPKDIQKADVSRFLINLEGFKINRARIEERFPGKKTDLIQWSV
ncbi:MAG: flagellar biosynthesis protein FlhF [Treponema sp.]|jgi:flagellar biosynthesis protein FlhF|nr:flagellar biosynthesis protein FlhF [Treponema sp.]